MNTTQEEPINCSAGGEVQSEKIGDNILREWYLWHSRDVISSSFSFKTKWSLYPRLKRCMLGQSRHNFNRTQDWEVWDAVVRDQQSWYFFSFKMENCYPWWSRSEWVSSRIRKKRCIRHRRDEISSSYTISNQIIRVELYRVQICSLIFGKLELQHSVNLMSRASLGRKPSLAAPNFFGPKRTPKKVYSFK